MLNAYASMWKKGLTFDGRTRRKDYWLAYLVNIIVVLIISFIMTLLDINSLSRTIGGIYSLLIFIPGIALTIRRLHDIGKSGVNILWGLLPCIGGIILLVFECTEGDRGTNQYGPDPKEAEMYT